MADAVVSFVLEKLCRLLVHEANLLRGVEDNVRSLENELRMIKAFLERCHQNQRKNEIEHEVVRQITDAAHEAEDVIDTFAANVVRNRRRSWLSKMLHGVDHAKLRHHVASKIDKINARLNEIHENRIKYDAQQEAQAGCSTDQELQLLHKRRREVEEDDVVGFQQDTAEGINRVKQGASRLNVVSIIGMGGLGKTTLARKIYNTSYVKNYFECRAWVYVSNDYRPRELLLSLLKCLVSFSANSTSMHKKNSSKAQSDDDFYSLSEEELIYKVREHLKGKRYLVVLDDIWKPQHWDQLCDAFPNDHTSSRILITSRSSEVASHTSSSSYDLPFLKQEESWELFSKRVFRGKGIPSYLELLGKEMVKSCGGLPISILVLAGILANKDKSYQEWSKIMGHVPSYLAQPETQVQQIVLQLSYDSLPARLRPCFLYFSIFPEDYEIPVSRLIQLWVAEGFILHIGSRIAEDVAENYLVELMHRSLVQIGRRRSDGAMKTCRIHDLLRELCISMSEKEKFFEVCRDADILNRTKPRRLSIHCKMSDFLVSSNKDSDFLVSSNKDLSGTHSILCFNQDPYKLDSSKSKRLVKVFPLVRVLDLGIPNLYWSKIPNNLNMLVHLRYLRINLEDTRNFKRGVKEIPKFMCNLWNLETLDLGRSSIFTETNFIPLSAGMWKLKRLRHLHMPRPVILHEFADVDNKSMWNLQTLSWVGINRRSSTGSLIEKGVFPKLRKLGLIVKDGKHRQEVDQVWKNLPKLNDLNALKIFSFPDIPTSFNPFPSNLTKLTIRGTKVNNYAMRALGSLTNLRTLKLWSCRCESDLKCMNGFPQLVYFEMVGMFPLIKWLLGRDVMPCLTSLIIIGCNLLEALPHELWSLTCLREVRLVRPSESVKKQLQSHPMRYACNLIIKEWS